MMHDRRPPAPARKRRRRKLTAQEEAERELVNQRKREHRKRDKKKIVVFPGRCSQAVIDAMVARNKFLGMTEKEAERKARDPKQISAEAFDILDHWAPNWYS